MEHEGEYESSRVETILQAFSTSQRQLSNFPLYSIVKTWQSKYEIINHSFLLTGMNSNKLVCSEKQQTKFQTFQFTAMSAWPRKKCQSTGNPY